MDCLSLLSVVLGLPNCSRAARPDWLQGWERNVQPEKNSESPWLNLHVETAVDIAFSTTSDSIWFNKCQRSHWGSLNSPCQERPLRQGRKLIKAILRDPRRRRLLTKIFCSLCVSNGIECSGFRYQDCRSCPWCKMLSSDLRWHLPVRSVTNFAGFICFSFLMSAFSVVSRQVPVPASKMSVATQV